MLAFPSFALAKENMPGTEIHALVPAYTEPMASSCQWVDKVILDPGKDASFRQNLNLLKRIKEEKYDAVISLFSTTRMGIILWLARIPYRLAPATKLAQFFYNNRLKQRRSRSEKPEYAYNMDLLFHFLYHQGCNNIHEPDSPYLEFPREDIDALKQEFISLHSIPVEHKLVFMHPGTGGSASNLSPEQYAELARKLQSTSGHTIIITAGPGEREIANRVADQLKEINHVVFESTSGLIDFSKHLQFADLFISGSTGTLHIAGALDTPTAAFYPRRRSATPLRWQTLNSPQKGLAFSPDEHSGIEDMASIDLVMAANKISSLLSNM